MRALVVTLVVLSLIAVACGDDGDATADGDTTAPEPDSTDPDDTGSSTTSTSSTTTTTTIAAAPRPEFPTPEVSDVDSLLALERPIVLGHAGGDQSWPHSTMYAFTQAAIAGVDALDMDVQLTGDGVLVVQHDDTVDRTTGTDGRVRDLTYDELQALDNGYWWSEEWASQDLPDAAYVYRGVRTGEVDPPPGFTAEDFRVETFRAVAEAFPDHVLNIELKRPRGDDGTEDIDFAVEGARVLAEEIEALGRTDSVVVVADNATVMTAFREFAPEVVTSPGTDAVVEWFLGGELAPSDRVLQVPPERDGITVLTELFFGLAADDGLEVWVWPPGSQETADFYQEFIELGADGVIAGRPADAVTRFREVFGD